MTIRFNRFRDLLKSSLVRHTVRSKYFEVFYSHTNRLFLFLLLLLLILSLHLMHTSEHTEYTILLMFLISNATSTGVCKQSNYFSVPLPKQTHFKCVNERYSFFCSSFYIVSLFFIQTLYLFCFFFFSLCFGLLINYRYKKSAFYIYIGFYTDHKLSAVSKINLLPMHL